MAADPDAADPQPRPGPDPGSDPAPNPGRWPALAVTQVAGFMSLLDVSIVNVALPSIQRGLDVSSDTAQWVVSGYALTFGLALVPSGRIGDIVGRRVMFLLALGAFVATSAVSGAAPTAETLIAARVLQGAAGGMLAPQISALIQNLFRGAERGRAFGVYGATIGLSTAAGPVAGGAILAVMTGPDGWRWVFYVNVPIGVVALVLAARLIPAVTGERDRTADRTPARRGPDLDLIGVLLLGTGVLGLLFPLVQADNGRAGALTWVVVPAVGVLVLFALWEGHVARDERQPLVDPRLARVSGYAVGLGIGFVYFLGFTGIWLVFARFFQGGLDYSPLRSGLAVTPYAIGVASSAVVAGRLVPRLGRWLTVSGLVAVAVGLAGAALVLRQVGGDAAAWAAAGPLLLGGLGGGMVVTPNLTLSLESVPVRMAGVAGGALQTGQRVGAAIGTAGLAGIFSTRLADTHDDAVAVSDTLLCASGVMLVALLLAVVELLRRRSRARRHPPTPRPEHHVHGII
jgi:EmrB/QacA subfamily drug resistance transporter